MNEIKAWYGGGYITSIDNDQIHTVDIPHGPDHVLAQRIGVRI